jgi:hypothetical protein
MSLEGVPPRSEIRWGNQTPGARRPGARRISPKPRERLELLCLSEAVTGVETHYIGGFTQPCRLPAETCAGCRRRIEQRWKGYLLVLMPYSQQLRLAELTPYAIESCPQLLTDGYALRGRQVILHRPGPYPNSPVLASVGRHTPLTDRYPNLDVMEILERIWEGGVRRSKRTLADIVPDPVYAPEEEPEPEPAKPEDVRKAIKRLRGEP